MTAGTWFGYDCCSATDGYSEDGKYFERSYLCLFLETGDAAEEEMGVPMLDIL